MKQATAIHEAAHALMAMQCGLEVTEIKVETHTGSCSYKGAHTIFDDWRITLAGPVAERFFYGTPHDCLTQHGGTGDLNSIADIGFANLITFEQSVTAWVEHYAPDIERLAATLLTPN